MIERAILRSVDRDPAKRPASAAALAAALPGGDPLAMMMAAGETPSPEMVARAGGEGALRPGVAVACLVLFLVGLGGIWIAEGRNHLENRVAMPKPPVELAIAARAVLAGAGYTRPPADSAFGFDRDWSYFGKVNRDDRSPQRWDNLRSVEPSPVWFWYRESPLPLEPVARLGTATASNPPLDRTGMTYVRLDPRGRLMRLRAIPPDLPEAPGPWTEPDWTRLLATAGFDEMSLAPVDPLWAPLEVSDVRRAWMTKDQLRIEAGAFRGGGLVFRDSGVATTRDRRCPAATPGRADRRAFPRARHRRRRAGQCVPRPPKHASRPRRSQGRVSVRGRRRGSRRGGGASWKL
jgi:hypothetical protein